MDNQPRRPLGMSQSNMIQLILAIAAITTMFVGYNECRDTSSRELQHIIEVEERLLENQEKIISRLDIQNGRIDRLESDGRLADYRITKVEEELQSP